VGLDLAHRVEMRADSRSHVGPPEVVGNRTRAKPSGTIARSRSYAPRTWQPI
jgi:hypothetical protein